MEKNIQLEKDFVTKIVKYLDAIIKRIEDSGFEVTRTTETQLTKDQAEEFYAAKKDEPYFQDLIQEMIRLLSIEKKIEFSTKIFFL